jgi:hypothetical protein
MWNARSKIRELFSNLIDNQSIIHDGKKEEARPKRNLNENGSSALEFVKAGEANVYDVYARFKTLKASTKKLR